jgi:hypothetical protein
MADAPAEIETLAPESERTPIPADTQPPPMDSGPVEQGAAEADNAIAPEPPGDVPPDVTMKEEPPAPEPSVVEKDVEDLKAIGVTIPRRLIDDYPELSVPDQPISMDARYQIFPARPLPELDSPSARAYEALDLQNPSAPLMALVPPPGLPLRKMEIEQIVGHEIPGHLALIDYGVVNWPHFGREVAVLVFERPLGGRVIGVLKSDIPDFKKGDVLRALVDTLLAGLRQLNLRNIVHHAIRPDNIFFLDEQQTRIVLGEFVSAPASFDQPVAFETIERGMADDAGRGTGQFSDDLYSFGATLAYLIQNQSPLRGLSRDDVLIAKLIHTSYQTLVGRHVLTARFLELMRGLMHDDPLQRWDYDAIDQWSNGRRVAPNPVPLSLRAQRPFRFGNVDHIQPRSLAFVMSRRRESAIRMIRDETLENWILKGIEDKELASSVRGRVEFVTGMKNVEDLDELLLTRILMVLDQLAPISYKTLNFFPSGFGTMLAFAIMRDDNETVRALAEVMQRDIPQIWFEAKPGGMAQNFLEDISFQRLRLNLQKSAPGYGIERILYELNPGLACKSPLLGTAHVAEIEELLPQLNTAERHVDPKQKPFDRHLAAFVAARAGSDTETFIDDFGSRDEAISSMAVLRLYSHLQSKYGPDVVLGLSRWIGGQVGPVIRLYHSRATRRDLETEIPSIVRRGSLSELLAVLDNPELRHNDQSGFAAAVTEFQSAETEINHIHLTSRPSSEHVQRTARQVAAVISILLMICIVTVMIMAR